MSKQTRYWFPAKRYGWGWGPPVTWQGWVVVGVHAALLAALCLLDPADRHPGRFWTALAAIIASLIAICWRTGAPPKWRWG